MWRSIKGRQHENPASLRVQVGWPCILVPLFWEVTFLWAAGGFHFCHFWTPLLSLI